jgi:threonine/homoserine/homoserine lactone efflux protein
VLAVLRLGEARAAWLTCIVVAGIFTGAMIWWVILTMVSAHFRERFDDRATLWMNRIAGMAIGGFGVLMMILSHWSKRQ